MSPAQIARIASHGVIRPITQGEVLIEGGQTNVPFFVVKAGEIEVIRPSALDEMLIAIVKPTQFTGDISMILGRPAQMRLRVRTSGEVVQLTRDQMHALVQTDAEISEVLMRAFIHRSSLGMESILSIPVTHSVLAYNTLVDAPAGYPRQCISHAARANSREKNPVPTGSQEDQPGEAGSAGGFE